MKTPTPHYRCPLGRLQPQSPDLDAIKQSGWQEQRIEHLLRNDFEWST